MRRLPMIMALTIMLAFLASNVFSDTYRVTNSTAASQNCVAVSDSSGHIYLFWQDNRSGNWEIYYKKIGINASPVFENAIQVTNSSGDAINPAVAIDGNIIHLAWQDNRSGNWEIYYKKITTNGDISTSMRITNTIGDSINPCISAKNNITFISWSEEENGNYFVYYYVKSQDNTPPSITILSPENKTYSYSNILINVSAQDIGGIGTVIAEIDDTTNITLTYSNGYYIGTAQTLGDGSHTIRIYAYDIDGNINSAQVSFTVDTTPPTIIITNPINNSNISLLNNSIEGNVSDLHGIENVSLYLNGNYITSWSEITFSKSVNYTPNSWNNIKIVAKDLLNNTAIAEIKVYVNRNISISKNVTANTTIVINETLNTASLELELAPLVNDSITVTVVTDTNVSKLINDTDNADFSAFALAHNEKAISKFVKIEVNGSNVNSTSNLSYAVIRVYYTLADVDKNGDGDTNDAGDIDPETLHLYRFCTNTKTWEEIPHGHGFICNGEVEVFDSGVNTSTRYIWANLSHLSVYGIGGSIVTTTTTTTTTAPAGGAYSPEVTILANSIDLSLAKEFIDYLEKEGIEVYIVDKNNFSSYNKKLYLIILGGHEAYEGVGEVVSKILSEEEKSRIKQEKAWIKKKGVYRVGQAVYILAGKDREATKQAWENSKEEIAKVIKYNWG